MVDFLSESEESEVRRLIHAGVVKSFQEGIRKLRVGQKFLCDFAEND